MKRNVFDPNQWANPAIGHMVLDALFGPPIPDHNWLYRPLGMSAREAIELICEDSPYYKGKLQLSANRLWIVLPMADGFKSSALESVLQRLMSFWSVDEATGMDVRYRKQDASPEEWKRICDDPNFDWEKYDTGREYINPAWLARQQGR